MRSGDSFQSAAFIKRSSWRAPTLRWLPLEQLWGLLHLGHFSLSVETSGLLNLARKKAGFENPQNANGCCWQVWLVYILFSMMTSELTKYCWGMSWRLNRFRVLVDLVVSFRGCWLQVIVTCSLVAPAHLCILISWQYMHAAFAYS
jgi:hypothetical protein